MTATLVTGIGELTTFDPAHPGPLGLVRDAAVLAVDYGVEPITIVRAVRALGARRVR